MYAQYFCSKIIKKYFSCVKANKDLKQEQQKRYSGVVLDILLIGSIVTNIITEWHTTFRRAFSNVA